MFFRTYLAISVAPKLHALSYMVSPLCRPVSAWAVGLFLPNLGVGRLVWCLENHSHITHHGLLPRRNPPPFFSRARSAEPAAPSLPCEIPAPRPPAPAPAPASASCAPRPKSQKPGPSRHCFAYIGSPNGPIQRPNPVRYVRYECYETTARSETRKLARVRDPRAAPPGEYGLKSGENGHLTRANWAIDGPYCSPTWPSVFGRRCEPLAGRGGGFGGWSCTSAHTRRVGRFFHSGALGKRAVPRPSAPGAGGYARGVWVSSPVLGRARGNKAVAFHNLQAFSNVQEEARSCARDQVVVARPPVLTPPMALSALSCA
jgi:hypothetical protein